MIQFRGSSAGKCTRELVLRHLKPELFTIPDGKRLFLDAGHYLQEAVEAFLRERLPAPFTLLSEWRESEGVHNEEEWGVTGHIDGLLEGGEDELYLLEVKAIKHSSFLKLKKAGHWKDVYGHYTYQAQTYLHFDKLEHEKHKNTFLDGPFLGTVFIFYDRDTSEMMGGFDLELEGYTYRSDMYERRNEEIWSFLMAKFTRAAACVEEANAPEDCDAEGYCFFCRKQGEGSQVRRQKRVGFAEDDWENRYLHGVLHSMRGYSSSVLEIFKDLKADILVLEDGTVLKKGDYE